MDNITQKIEEIKEQVTSGLDSINLDGLKDISVDSLGDIPQQITDAGGEFIESAKGKIDELSQSLSDSASDAASEALDGIFGKVKDLFK